MQRDMQTCHECGDILSEENRYHYSMKSGRAEKPKIYHSSICRPCKQLHAGVRATLMKLHPPPPPGTPCACCNRIDKLFLDHCHVLARYDWKKSYRGYICRQCNSGVGMLGDCEAGLERALKYLKRDGRSDEGATGRALEDKGLSIADPSLPMGTEERVEGDNEAGANLLGREAEYHPA
jgi:hypothetical protein